MAATEETFPIACKGGLDTTTNTQELLEKPGWATRLLNFEPSNDGGYRRINGYTPIGQIDVNDTSPIKGTYLVDDRAAIVCQGSNVYFSFDLSNWIAINRELDLVTNPTGVDFVQLQAADLKTRENSLHYDFEIFRKGLKVTVVGVSEGHNPFYFEVEGTTLANSTYLYKEITISEGSLVGARRCEKFVDQLVISGMDSAPAEIYVSDILKPDDFEGANASALGFNDEVVGLQMFREDLYVFCKNSIHKVTGLNSGQQKREPVTTRIGCISGDSIRELAGDIVFLAPDGLRTLSATERIGDVNLASLTESVANRLRVLAKQISDYDVVSETLKNKAQYRIFFKSKTGFSRYALIMYMRTDDQTGKVIPEFSELTGFDIAAMHNGFYKGEERTISGDRDGKLWWHDEGSTMNGSNIYFLYETPFFSMGDPAVRKNIHKIVTYMKVEGVTSFNIALKFDFDSTDSYAPAPYPVGPLKAPSVYGSSRYNRNVAYGTEKSPTIATLTEGSGRNMAIRFFPSGEECDPFSLQGFDVLYVPAGRI